jgi:hypothetical protein
MVEKTRKSPTCDFRKVTLKVANKKSKLSKSFDLFNLRYESPVKKDLAVGLVYFNAAKSKRLLMNYLYAVEKLKIAGIPNYTIEMYEESPELSSATLYVKTEFTLFQKERLCYLLEKNIPKSFTKLLFMDCDLIFENMNWYNDLSEKLDSSNIVQPFSKGIWLDITYKNIVKERIPISFFQKLGKIPMEGGIGGYHPGFAWGFQRAWYNKIGFFQHAILGDGDSISSTVWLDYKDFKYRDFVRPALEDYRKKITEQPTVCFLNGAVYHLWHGDATKRQYSKRREIFKSVKDVRTILRVAENGLFELKNDSLKSKIRKYFKNRDDDGLEAPASNNFYFF